MTGSVVIGLVMWVLMIWGSRRLARWGRSKQAGATCSTVSGNGRKWEQDVPMIECFDEMEDDL